MNVTDTEPKEGFGFLCLSMTQTEDRILRELSKNDGTMTSEDLRKALVLQESTDNIYGALRVLDDEGYTTSALVVPWEWLHNYRVGTIHLTAKGQRHVETTAPVRTGWTRIFLSLILFGGLLSGVQSLYKVPDYGPIGLSLVAAGVLMIVGRRFGLILTVKKGRH
jgi:hypothetical protein